MKAGWVVRKVSDVCTLDTGGTPSRSHPEYFGGDIKWLVSGDIHQREILDCEGRITEAGLRSSNAKLLPINSVLIALNGQGKTRGTVAILRTQATCNQSLVSISPKDASVLLPEFLYAYLHGRYQQIRRMTGDDGNDRRGLNMRLIGGIEVPIAPLAEQKRIVVILDKALQAINTATVNCERNIENARGLFRSYLGSVLSNRQWRISPLGDVCERVEYGSSAKSKKVGGMPVLRMGNIQNGKITWDNLVYSDDKSEIQKYLLAHNDVLFNRTNSPELVGKTAIYKSEMPAIFAGYLIRVVVRADTLDADYLNYFLNSETAFEYGKTVVTSSVHQANINGAKLKTYPIPVPPLLDQKCIVGTLDALEAETARLQKNHYAKIQALTALKDSLLHQGFSGNI
jgi:type I restriction enzyme, S subunit